MPSQARLRQSAATSARPRYSILGKAELRWFAPLFFLLLPFAAYGANLTGVWKGSLIFNDGGNTQARLQLKQNGKSLTGVMSLSEGHDFKIDQGDVTGKQITVSAPTGASVLKMTLRWKGAMLSGDAFEDDAKIGSVSLRRQK